MSLLTIYLPSTCVGEKKKNSFDFPSLSIQFVNLLLSRIDERKKNEKCWKAETEKQRNLKSRNRMEIERRKAKKIRSKRIDRKERNRDKKILDRC